MNRYAKLWAAIATPVVMFVVSFATPEAMDAVLPYLTPLLTALGVYAVPNAS